jgi:hypothetical protein
MKNYLELLVEGKTPEEEDIQKKKEKEESDDDLEEGCKKDVKEESDEEEKEDDSKDDISEAKVSETEGDKSANKPKDVQTEKGDGSDPKRKQDKGSQDKKDDVAKASGQDQKEEGNQEELKAYDFITKKPAPITKESVKEDIDALLEGGEFSEEFRKKTETIFEAAINSRLEKVVEEIEQGYEENLEKEAKEIVKQLAEGLESYLDYVAEEFVEENSVAIDSGIKQEACDSLLEALKGVLEEHYVEVPEKTDLLDETQSKLADAEAKLNEEINKVIELRKKLAEAKQADIIDEIADGLSLAEGEKFKEKANGVSFENADQYREDLAVIKENYFPSEAKKGEEIDKPIENAKQDGVQDGAKTATQMGSIVQAINWMTKK